MHGKPKKKTQYGIKKNRGKGPKLGFEYLLTYKTFHCVLGLPEIKTDRRSSFIDLFLSSSPVVLDGGKGGGHLANSYEGHTFVQASLASGGRGCVKCSAVH